MIFLAVRALFWLLVVLLMLRFGFPALVVFVFIFGAMAVAENGSSVAWFGEGALNDSCGGYIPGMVDKLQMHDRGRLEADDGS